VSWLSSQWKKSKRKKTGIFSWGDSDLAKLIPGVGEGLDSALDALASTAESSKGSPVLPSPRIMSSQEVQQQTMLMYIGGAVLLYFVLK